MYIYTFKDIYIYITGSYHQSIPWIPSTSTWSFALRARAHRCRFAAPQQHHLAALQPATSRPHVAVHQDQTQLAGTGGLENIGMITGTI